MQEQCNEDIVLRCEALSSLSEMKCKARVVSHFIFDTRTLCPPPKCYCFSDLAQNLMHASQIAATVNRFLSVSLTSTKTTASMETIKTYMPH